MRTEYTFSIVRYVHDVVAGEFVNVGVVLYAPKNNYIDAICTRKYGRIARLFIDVEGGQFRSLMNFLENRIDEVRHKLQTELPFDSKPRDVAEILYKIIPKDDSSLQFSDPGGGLTEDPSKTLKELYERYVERYTEKPRAARDDQQVWKVFKKPLEERQVVKYLKPHIIEAPDYRYQFDHTWQNNKWHVLEPLSFDLEYPDSITEKAARWIGRTVALQNAKEKFKLYLLIGKPLRRELMNSYIKAENLLNKIPVEKEIVPEGDEEEFADEVQNEIQKHLAGK